MNRQVARPPSAPRLPDGFAVQLDPRTRWVGERVLLGGTPLRLLRLSATAAERLSDPLTVHDATTAALARRLLDAGAAHPRPAAGPAADTVTVVVPVKDRPAGLTRLLDAVTATTDDCPIVVVDDGSLDAAAVTRIAARHGASVHRHERARGPAAARNAGLRLVGTPYAALIDSDCVPQPGWLDRLLTHLADPLVAAVAPRIVATGTGTGSAAAYEAVASALDLGPREGAVAPHARVPYVPSAALLVRRAALGDGYDEAMHVAEDVDLVWRLVAGGWRVRYEPAATVAHDHRTDLLGWARRRAFYGTGAARLAERHHGAVSPLVLSPWSLAAWAALLAGPRRGLPLAVALLGMAAVRLRTRLEGVRRPAALAVGLVGLGTAYSGRQLASALVRHYWPLALPAAVVSVRARRWVAVAAAADAGAAWWPHRGRIGLPAFAVLRRVDDLCYGAGLWWGALRRGSLAALLPRGARR